MININIVEIVILILLSLGLSYTKVSAMSEDLPCVPVETLFSPICMCYDKYCDTITAKSPLSSGRYRVYTTSQSGLRFSMDEGETELLQPTTLLDIPLSIITAEQIIEIDTETKYQKLIGFGGALTDTTAYNWKRLVPAARKKLLEAYFGHKGLQYNCVRYPIAGTDFSPRPYSYNDNPIDDYHLKNFSLTNEDYQLRIPMLKSIIKTSSIPVKLLATLWSPPLWMKDSGKWTGHSRLKEKCYQTLADYYIRFFEEYEKQGIKFWGVSTGNEPEISDQFSFADVPSLGWTPKLLAHWIVKNFGPTIKNSKFKDLIVITIDGMRDIILKWMDEMVETSKEVLKYVDGIGIHTYLDFITPSSYLVQTHDKYRNHFTLETEGCSGVMSIIRIEPGSWSRAESYVKSIMTNLNNFVCGWIDWNLVLDKNGGPNWIKIGIDSPIIVLNRTHFYKNPMYYAMGHFSKFLPEGSIRIDSQIVTEGLLECTAFVRPDGCYVVIVKNGYAQLSNASYADLHYPRRYWINRGGFEYQNNFYEYANHNNDGRKINKNLRNIFIE